MGDVPADLESQLDGAEGAERIRLLIRICRHSRRRVPARAISAAREAVILAREQDDPVLLVRALLAHGGSLLDCGEGEAAVNLLGESLARAERLGERDLIMKTLGLLGLAYFVLEQDEVARRYHERERDLATECGSRTGLANAGLGLGMIAARADRLDEALPHFERALEIGRELEDDRIVLSAINNVGMVHQGCGNHERALGCFEESLEFKRKIGDVKGEAGALINTGRSLLTLGRFEEARSRIVEGLSLARSVQATDFEAVAYNALAVVEEARNDLAEALKAERNGRALRDRMFSEEQARSIAEMRARFETERAEREAELHRLQNLELTHQLRQAQRMEAVGRLAGGVAHDFNNLLTAIMGYAEILTATIEDEGRRKSAREIQQAANRAASLTRQLLAFSRKQVVEPKVMQLNAVVQGLEGMIGRLIGEDVDFRTRLDPEAGSVLIDHGQMEQVVVNLVVNGRDAMPEGGVLTLATENVVIGATAATTLDLEPGRYARLTVTDTGCGMDPDTMAHIFEPFFTTKSRDKGTGLGLATVYGIIQQGGGSITVRSEPGKGAEFRVLLPLVVDARAEGPPERTPDPELRGRETILLVEDDETVRDLAYELLRGMGYRVIAAGSGEEALSLVGSGDRAVDLLLTDVVLSGISGTELASSLAHRLPETRVLYMSGYTADAIMERGVLRPGTQFLAKPFGPRVLARRIREVLDRA